MEIRRLAPQHLDAVERLCERELTLDSHTAGLPGVLMRRPHVGLVAVRGEEVLGVCFGSVSEYRAAGREGFLDLIVVARGEREHGIGRRLVAELESELAARGCEVARIAGNPPHYAWPGIDVRYTPAICFAEDLGYTRGRCVVTMEVDLKRNSLATEAHEARLSELGITIHRAGIEELEDLKPSLKQTWDDAWIAEITAALSYAGAGLHVAMREGECVGFCAYGVNRPNEVGPIGTVPNLRRVGVAGILLRHSLRDQRDSGLAAADLVWVLPLKPVSRSFGATISRAFWMYQKDLPR
jgi:GNAT superfamily N-acetyltransferase